MNATQNRPGTQVRDELEQILLHLDRVRQLISPGSTMPNARAALESAVGELESLIPTISAHVVSESLLSQDWDSNGRQRMEQHISEIRSKVRELQALLDSGQRLIEEGTDSEETDPVSEALNAYLLPTLNDTIEALEAQRELRAASVESSSKS